MNKHILFEVLIGFVAGWLLCRVCRQHRTAARCRPLTHHERAASVAELIARAPKSNLTKGNDRWTFEWPPNDSGLNGRQK